ncbi:Uu.00g072860.m01.CDS01 [Anthostomella pinea]|uniref:Uu.00g072860.m01.CDS01 n=1 Tax=Anthostomella pinea TaxID=933095 RepID=A0AAI8YP07_9PEZI|nr:Uu.00g072860.m01.CDS01 [Anthostomella pinea]
MYILSAVLLSFAVLGVSATPVADKHASSNEVSGPPGLVQSLWNRGMRLSPQLEDEIWGPYYRCIEDIYQQRHPPPTLSENASADDRDARAKEEAKFDEKARADCKDIPDEVRDRLKELQG